MYLLGGPKYVAKTSLRFTNTSPENVCGSGNLAAYFNIWKYGSVWHYLRFKRELLPKWFDHGIRFAYNWCFILQISVEFIKKHSEVCLRTNFQSHLVFHYVWGWFFSLKNRSILAPRSKKSWENFTTVELSNSHVAKQERFSFNFWQKFTELMGKPTRVKKCTITWLVQ